MGNQVPVYLSGVPDADRVVLHGLQRRIRVYGETIVHEVIISPGKRGLNDADQAISCFDHSRA
ncbi:hypothetical protein D3C75_788830 [compost metagenome]